jgi:hypothetical protein
LKTISSKKNSMRKPATNLMRNWKTPGRRKNLIAVIDPSKQVAIPGEAMAAAVAVATAAAAGDHRVVVAAVVPAGVATEDDEAPVAVAAAVVAVDAAVAPKVGVAADADTRIRPGHSR